MGSSGAGPKHSAQYFGNELRCGACGIAKSDLVRRILSDDPHTKMPTPESNLALTSYEKAVLIKWVEQGAKYKPHWAYVAPEKAAIPDISNPNWKINNAVDPFVYQKLEEQDLKPAPQADQQTLIRRLSFDIRGISPSVKEINDFIAGLKHVEGSKIQKKLPGFNL